MGKTECGKPTHKLEDDATLIVDNYNVNLRNVLSGQSIVIYVVGSKSFRPDI